MQKQDADMLNEFDLGPDFEIGEYEEDRYDREDEGVGVVDDLDNYYDDYNEDVKKEKDDWMRVNYYNEN